LFESAVQLSNERSVDSLFFLRGYTTWGHSGKYCWRKCWLFDRPPRKTSRHAATTNKIANEEVQVHSWKIQRTRS